MGDCHCCILIKKKLCNWKAYDIASSDNHCPLALDIHSGNLKHLYDALRGTWKDTVLFLPESCNVERMETVYILLFGYCCNDLILAYMFWKRELNKNTIYGVISIKFLDESEKFCLRNSIWLTDSCVLYSHIFRSLCLAGNI